MTLGAQPRIRLATLPTPLQEAPRLRAALGGPARCPRIAIKRDDLTGLAFGGNKVRKLEFLVAEALARGATTLVTAGAVQSNHARATAAAARIAGLQTVLVLETTHDDPPVQGNLLLDRLLGAEVRIVAAGTDMDAAMTTEADRLTAAGERPVVIPVGGSNATGVFGYVAATLELLGQCLEQGFSPSRLYYANGSRGTQAGLALGARLYNAPWRVQGIAVSGNAEVKLQRALRISAEAAERLGVAVRVEATDLANDERQIGEGYGIPTPACLEAIAMLARTEALFLDPVYSGKAMAGLIDHIRRGEVDPAETVIVLHSGGTPALFAQAETVAEHSSVAGPFDEPHADNDPAGPVAGWPFETQAARAWGAAPCRRVAPWTACLQGAGAGA